MALVANLNDPGRALANVIKAELSPTIPDVSTGAPHANEGLSTESVRVTLMWVTPQPTHKNDGWVKDESGQLVPAPVTLSAFYLVTCYGTNTTGQNAQAINLLGQIIQILETKNQISFPAPGPINGEGHCEVVFVPTAADLMEKVYSPLQGKHRPWALFEVGPIQLRRRVDPRPAPNPVAPGGINLTGPGAQSRPVIAQITPSIFRAGGTVRLDLLNLGGADKIRLGEDIFTMTENPSNADEIALPDELGRIFVTYPNGSPTGDIEVVLIGESATSNLKSARVSLAGVSGLDALSSPVSIGNDLKLPGGNLNTVEQIFIWPDKSVQSPLEVSKIDLPNSAVTLSEITIVKASLQALNLKPGAYRVAAKTNNGQFTPYILMELTA